MRKNFRKSLSLLMALCMMVLSMLPTTAYAAPNDSYFHIMAMEDIKNFVAAENGISSIDGVKIHSITVYGTVKDSGNPGQCTGIALIDHGYGYDNNGDKGLQGTNGKYTQGDAWRVLNSWDTLEDDSVTGITVYAKDGDVKISAKAGKDRIEVRDAPNVHEITLLKATYEVEYYFIDEAGNKTPAGTEPGEAWAVSRGEISIKGASELDGYDETTHYVYDKDESSTSLVWDENGQTFTVCYAVDGNNNDIPDYQEKYVDVTYKIVGGTWSDGTAEDKTETLMLDNGTATLTKVPTPGGPIEGYTEPGAWDSTPVAGETTVTEDTVYTYAFTEDQGSTDYWGGIRVYMDDATETDFDQLDGLAKQVRIYSDKYPGGYWFGGENVVEGYWHVDNISQDVTADDITQIALVRDKASGGSSKIEIPIEGNDDYEVRVSTETGPAGIVPYLRIDISKKDSDPVTDVAYDTIRIYLDQETQNYFDALDGYDKDVRIYSDRYANEPNDEHGHYRTCPDDTLGYYYTANSELNVTADDIDGFSLVKDRTGEPSAKIYIPADGNEKYDVAFSVMEWGDNEKALRVDITKKADTGAVLTIEKKATWVNNIVWSDILRPDVGDKITYEVTIWNYSQTAAENVTVKDTFFGNGVTSVEYETKYFKDGIYHPDNEGTLDVSDGQITIPSIPESRKRRVNDDYEPGKCVITYTYTVQADDVDQYENRELVNTAEAAGKTATETIILAKTGGAATDSEIHTMYMEAIKNKVRDAYDLADSAKVEIQRVYAHGKNLSNKDQWTQHIAREFLDLGPVLGTNAQKLNEDWWLTLNTPDPIQAGTIDKIEIVAKVPGHAENQRITVWADHIRNTALAETGIKHIAELYLKFDVTFDANGVEGLTAPVAQIVEYGTHVSEPDTGDLEITWYTDAACTPGNEWDFTVDTVSRNTTLYAKVKPTSTTPDNGYDSLKDVIDVTVTCANPEHTAKTYDLQDKSFTAYPVTGTGAEGDPYTCTVDVYGNPYVALYNDPSTGVTSGHKLTSADTVPVELIWDAGSEVWTVKDDKNPVNFQVTCQPDAPDEDDLTALFSGKIQVICDTLPAIHNAKTYGLLKNSYATGEVKWNGAAWEYNLAIRCGEYVKAYNTNIPSTSGHVLAPGENGEKAVTLLWTDKEWKIDTSVPVQFKVTCDPAATYTLTYDLNGGHLESDPEATVWVDEAIYATDAHTLKSSENIGLVHEQNDVAFIGWTTDGTAKGHTYSAGESLPELVTTVAIPVTQTVYAVWGEDENDDGTADALQIVIQPADITIYTGGTGYDGVVEDQNGNLVADSGSGLPEPGYYFTLPYELDQYLRELTNAEAGQPVNLEQHIRLQDETDESRMWILQLYDGAETSSAGGRYIYRLAETATGNSPAKLQISDGNKIVTSDEFFISSSALYQEYQMSLYPGAASAGNIIVELSKDGSQWNGLDDLQGVGTVEGLSLTKGTLTIRGENNNTPTLTINLGENTAAVAGNNAIANEESKTTITAVVEDLDNATFTINGSNVRTDGQIALFTDGLLPNDVLDNYLKEKGILSDTAQVDYQYLDLVDTSNGNAYVTTGDDVAIYWKLPADADPKGTFQIVHFNGLDRNYDVGDLSSLIGTPDYEVNVYSFGSGLTWETIGDDLYLKFTTSTFSPFALVYDAKDAPQPGDTYTLTYDANALGGTVSGMPAPNPVTGLSNGSYTLSTARPTHSDVDGTDVVFIGWTETPTTKIFSKNDTAPATVTAVTINGANETVYAAWGYDVNGNGTPDVKETKYTLTYHANYRGNDGTSEYVYVAGEKVVVKGRLFSRSGYSFDEWNTRSNGRGTSYDRGDVFTMPAHDEDLYAQWTPRGSGDDDDDSYAVYYHPGYGRDARKLDAFYEVGETVEVLDNEWFQRDDYVFIGWSRTLDDDSPDYLPGDTFKMPSGTVDLYAQWKKVGIGPGDTGVADWLNTDDHIAYLAGYPGNLFGPDNSMTRAEVCQMFYTLLENKNVTITKTFNDVPADAWYTTAVNTLATLGMVSGYPDGSFRPNDPITRAEFCTIALAFAYEPEDATCSFTDVFVSDWFYPYVAQASTYGWIGGYPDGSFGPREHITRTEVTTIVNRMLGREADRNFVDRNEDELKQFIDLSDNYWGYYQIMEAVNSHEYERSNGVEDWIDLLP